MAARLDDPPTLDEVAGAAGVGRRQLTRCYRAELGVAPVEHRTRARIEEAARRLVETEDPISTIALELGFKSLAGLQVAGRRRDPHQRVEGATIAVSRLRLCLRDRRALHLWDQVWYKQ